MTSSSRQDKIRALMIEEIQTLCVQNGGMIDAERGEADGCIVWVVRADGETLAFGDYNYLKDEDCDTRDPPSGVEAEFLCRIEDLPMTELALLIEVNTWPNAAMRQEHGWVKTQNNPALNAWGQEALSNLGLGM